MSRWILDVKLRVCLVCGKVVSRLTNTVHKIKASLTELESDVKIDTVHKIEAHLVSGMLVWRETGSVFMYSCIL